MEVVPAARRRLMEVPGIRGYVQDRVFVHKLYEHVDKTGKRAIVCRTNGGWYEPPRVGRAAYPVLAIDCWADCTRNADGDKMGDDCVLNAFAVYRAVDLVLHQIREEHWGSGGSTIGLLVVDCKRWTEPIVQTKDESHGGVAYGVELGESAVVTTQYALTVAH